MALLLCCGLVAASVALSLYLLILIQKVKGEIDLLLVYSKEASNASAYQVQVLSRPYVEHGTARSSKFVEWRENQRNVRQIPGFERNSLRGAANQFTVRKRFLELYQMLDISDAEILSFELEAAQSGLTFRKLITVDPKNNEAYKKAQAQELERVVEKTLGAEYIEPFRLYLLSSEMRSAVSEISAYSIGLSEPLSREQSDELITAILGSRRTKSPQTIIEYDEVDWISVIEKSHAILQPSQRILLVSWVDRQNFEKSWKETTGLPLRRPVRGI